MENDDVEKSSLDPPHVSPLPSQLYRQGVGAAFQQIKFPCDNRIVTVYGDPDAKLSRVGANCSYIGRAPLYNGGGGAGPYR